jgi:protein required for attachment to host cells
MLIPHGTVVALADGAGLALFRNAGTETALKLSPLPAPKLDAHSKDAGKRHRSSTANPDKKLLQEDSLAAAVADWLNHQALEGKFEHVVVAAPAKFLGEMRRLYHKALQAKLIGELHKDIRELPLKDIEAELTHAKPA